MAIELTGQKCGMTRVFTENGASVPVTVILVQPNVVTQIKDLDVDGYKAVQVTYGEKKKPSKVTKAVAGHYAKAKVQAGNGLREFCVGKDKEMTAKVGDAFEVDVFKVGDIVDVEGVSRGKGFAGVIKRYHFRCQDASHGNSLSHRAPGSIGQRQTPGRVFKGKKMCGHMGDAQCIVQNQEIVQVDKERNLLFVKGGIPGAPNGRVIIKFAIKNKGNAHGA